jgi:hypothetical protein
VVHEEVPAICIEDKPLFFNIEKPSSPKKTAASLKFTHVTSGILSGTFTVLLAVHQKNFGAPADSDFALCTILFTG